MVSELDSPNIGVNHVNRLTAPFLVLISYLKRPFSFNQSFLPILIIDYWTIHDVIIDRL